MIKQIVHLSDIHIRTTQFHDLYKNQFNSLIEELKIKLSKYEYEEIRIVLTGDIFHQKITVSNEQTLLASWFFSELAKIGKLIILPGNHDFLENNITRIDSITPIVELLRNENITYFKNMGVYDDENIKWVVYSLYNHNEKTNFVKEEAYTYVGLFHDPIQGMTTDMGYMFDTAYDKLNFIGCDIVLCGDIHKRNVLIIEDVMEIDEEDLNFYLKSGWKI
jgi:DNA repair exonuclease SbcCD nuclease subunit